MELKGRSYCKGDYENHINFLTKENMKQLFIKNFGGWNDSVSERKFFEVLDTGFVQLFFLDKTFVGFVSFNEENDYCSVHEIQVIKSFQRMGFGTKIMGFVIEKAKELNLEEIRLLVFKDNPSVEFYLSLGFKKIEFIEKSNTYVMLLLL